MLSFKSVWLVYRILGRISEKGSYFWRQELRDYGLKLSDNIAKNAIYICRLLLSNIWTQFIYFKRAIQLRLNHIRIV